MQKSRIIGLGSYLPKKILTNQDLEKMVETTDEWIYSRTGIKERRIADEDETASSMGAAAAEKALKASGKSIRDIDMILVCTMTPDYLTPATATLIQHLLKAHHAAAVDMQAACTGFLYALSMAKAYVESDLYRNILVVATEKMSAFIDYKDRNTCILFGDGAAAAVVAPEGSGFAINTICLGADGSLADLLMIPGGGSVKPATLETIEQRLHYFKMDGKEVFRQAVRRMEASARTCLEKAGVSEKEVSWLVPHQANIRIIEALAKNFDLLPEQVFKTVHKYGNTSASSIPIALDELIQEKNIQENEHILLVAVGAGLTWGAALLTKTENGFYG